MSTCSRFKVQNDHGNHITVSSIEIVNSFIGGMIMNNLLTLLGPK